MDSKEAALEVFSDMQDLLKLILNLVGTEDNDKVKYFLNLALKGVLEKVLQWNLPPTPDSPKLYYSLDVDMMLLKIFGNLVSSGEAFGHGSHIAQDEKDFWILQHFAEKLSHPRYDVRRDTLDFFISLIRHLEGQHKDLVCDRLDLIRQVLYIMTHESHPILLCK